VHNQGSTDAFYCIVDLHALTVPKDPGVVGAGTIDLTRELLACGLDPKEVTLFVQSHVPAHSEMGWLLQCNTSFGELSRMTQFKDKSGKQRDYVSGGLFTYPSLMAADILLYDTQKVPVGDDQRQHIELARDVAERFNSRYGDTFVVPEALIGAAGARVMDLQVPTDKMSKSSESDAGTILIADDIAKTAKKIKRAVTDSDNDVRYDIKEKPGVANLLGILGAATDRDPRSLADEYTQYGPLKSDTADAVVALLEPIQERLSDLEADPAVVSDAMRSGSAKAATVANATLKRAMDNIGLAPA
jgi:tryptophanyl-tRNA synthetase